MFLFRGSASGRWFLLDKGRIFVGKVFLGARPLAASLSQPIHSLWAKEISFSEVNQIHE